MRPLLRPTLGLLKASNSGPAEQPVGILEVDHPDGEGGGEGGPGLHVPLDVGQGPHPAHEVGDERVGIEHLRCAVRVVSGLHLMVCSCGLWFAVNG